MIASIWKDGEIACRGRRAWFTHVALDRHQQAIAFHDVNVLSREGKFDYHLGGIVRLERRYVVIAGRRRRHGGAAREQSHRSQGHEEKETK